MERRHYRRILNKAIEEASVGLPPERNWRKPVAIGGSVLAVVLLGWFFISRVMPDPALQSDGGEERTADAPGVLSIAVVEEFVMSFLSTETLEEMVTMVEDPEENGPRIRAFLEDADKTLPLSGQILEMAELDYEGQPVYEALISGVFGATSVLPVRAGADGKPLINWEWASGWTAPSWEKLLEEKSEEPAVAKVYLSIDDYYNYEYRDEKKWQSVRLTDPVMETFAYGFINRSNPDAAIFAGHVGYAPVTVEVKFAPGQTRDLVEIAKLHSIGWIFEEGDAKEGEE